MSEMRQIPHSLKEMDSFSRQEYTDAMASNYSMTGPQIAYDLADSRLRRSSKTQIPVRERRNSRSHQVVIGGQNMTGSC